MDTARHPHPAAPSPAMLVCSEAGVMDAADHATEQAARWTRIARAIGRRPDARGYRLAVSRAGIWTLRARRAERVAARQLVTASERLRLAQWEREAVRYEVFRAEADANGYDLGRGLALAAK